LRERKRRGYLLPDLLPNIRSSPRAADRFVVAGGRLFVLRPASYQAELRGPEQRVYSQRIGPGSPGPALRQDLRIS